MWKIGGWGGGGRLKPAVLDSCTEVWQPIRGGSPFLGDDPQVLKQVANLSCLKCKKDTSKCRHLFAGAFVFHSLHHWPTCIWRKLGSSATAQLVERSLPISRSKGPRFESRLGWAWERKKLREASMMFNDFILSLSDSQSLVENPQHWAWSWQLKIFLGN